jgi:serine/threonine-protein phosphatase CPPED1
MRSLRSAILLLILITAACPVVCAKAFFFVQIADTQLGMAANNANMDQEIDNFSKAVEDINRLKPAFVVISGDLTNAIHDQKQMDAFWEIAHRIHKDIPLHLVAGNHDVGAATESDLKSYREAYGDDRYVFRYEKSSFIVLDSSLIHPPCENQVERDAQRKWFETELNKAKARKSKHIFVLTHHSWFLTKPDEPDQYFNIPLSYRPEYLKLMKDAGVDCALAGHQHANSLGKDGNLTMITTSSLGRALGADPVGFRIFRVYDDRVEQEYYPLGKVPEKVW